MSHLKCLFTAMYIHGCVPDAFGVGIVVPIAKDKQGDRSAVDNYRPITINPVISKLFEIILFDKYAKDLATDILQFGFKKNVGCKTALFALRQTVNYFTNRGSNVYIYVRLMPARHLTVLIISNCLAF